MALRGMERRNGRRAADQTAKLAGAYIPMFGRKLGQKRGGIFD